MGFLDIIRETASKLLDDKSNENTLYLRKRTPDELLRLRFRLPEPEGIVIQIPAAIELAPLGYNVIHSNSVPPPHFIDGKMTLTESFLCFEAADEPRKLTFSIPLSTIRRAERLPSQSSIHSLKIALIQDLQLIVQIDGLFTNCDEFCRQLGSNLRTQVPLSKPLRQIIKTFYSEYLVESATRLKRGQAKLEIQQSVEAPAGGLGREFGYPGDPKTSHERSKMRLWLEYLTSHGRNLGMVKTLEFYKLIRVGLPNSLRGEMWEICCGSVFDRMKSSQLYSGLLEDHLGQTSQATEEIAKDLKRSLPEYAAYQSDVGIERLRRVLVAYSWMCPDVGYCQAMNIVGATLLMFQTEEQAFWTLHALVHRILPGYYSRTMYGMLLDQKVLEKLVESTMPALWAHLQNVDVPLSVISLPWFLSLFANSMPLPFALRIIDILMMEGSKFLFQVSLAVLRVNEDKLLEADDNTLVVAVLKGYFTKLGESRPSTNNPNKRVTHFQELLVSAFRDFGIVTDGWIHDLRGKYETPVLDDIESYAKKTAVRRLAKPRNITLDQLCVVYDAFYTALQSSRPGLGGEKGELQFYQFVSFLKSTVIWMGDQYVSKGDAEHNVFIKKLFLSWDLNKSGTLTLADCATGLDKMANMDMMESINTFFSIFADDNNAVDGQTILDMADGFLFIMKPFTSKHEGSITLDSISRLELNKLGGVPPHVVEESVEKIQQQQSSRYLAAVSSFIQRCFEVAGLRQVEVEPKNGRAEVHEAKSLIDIEEQDPTKETLDPMDPPKQLNLAHFRMVVLADETLELFFSNTLQSTISLHTNDTSSHFSAPSLRSVMDAVVREGTQFADGLRGRSHVQVQVTESQDEFGEDLMVQPSDRALLDI